MASSALLLLCVSFVIASSLANVTPLFGSCGFGDRQMTQTDRIRNFLDCLRNQGHDDAILTELKKTFEDQLATPSPTKSNCPPADTGSHALGRFPYCSEMSELQCRTLVLVLDSLVNAPPRTPYGGGISVEKIFRDPVQVVSENSPSSSSSSASSTNDEEEAQEALMNIILARFNDILEEYKRWRMETGGRQKRSPVDSTDTVQQPPITDDRNGNKTATSGHKSDATTPEEGAKFVPEITSLRRMPSVRMRRQADPGLPFKIPAKLTPEMQAVLEGYLAWREKNGYGKMSGRWG